MMINAFIKGRCLFEQNTTRRLEKTKKILAEVEATEPQSRIELSPRFLRPL